MCDIDDGLPIEHIVNICEAIQKDFLLSDIYILRTANGWNLFSLDKLSLKLVWIINNCFEESCKDYNRISFYIRKFYVLRMGADKTLEHVAKSDNHVFVKSNAHRIFFENIINGFHDYDQDLRDFDEYEKFVITKFKSSKHGWRLID